MQNTDLNQKSKTKFTNRLLIIVILVVGLILLTIAIAYLFFGGGDEKPKTIQVEQNQILESGLLDTTNIDSNGVQFVIPGGYSAKETDDGIYVVANGDKKDESVIIVNTANAKDSDIEYEDIVLNESNKLIDKVEKEIPNGIKMFGLIDTVPTLISILKTDEGVVVIKSSGDKITEAIFDAITGSVETN